VLGQPYGLGDKIAKAMPPLVMGRDTPLRACFELEPKYEDGYKMAGELRDMYATDPQAKQVIDVAKGLEGLRRQDGIHAAAVVITRHPLTDYLPIQRKPEAGGNIEDAPVVTQYEMHGVEDLGLLKMDFLGLRNLDVISDTLDLIERTRGERVDIDHIPLDDPPTYELLGRGDTIGVFQLEGSAMRDLIRRLAPSSFDDVAALVALYRPGPMSVNMHTDYADIKNGRKEAKFFHPEAEELLADTYGLMIYQESVMRVAQHFAGYSLAEADNLRKACLPAGTQVLTKSRGYVAIEKLARLSDRRVHTIDTTAATSHFEAVDDVWSVGTKPVYRLTTSTGHTIEATSNHPFLVGDRWTELGEIRPGDLVAVAARTRTDGNGKIPLHDVDLAALLISEGYTPDVRTTHASSFFANTDPELLDAFRDAYERHFGRSHRAEETIQGVTRLRLRRAELLELEPVLGGLGLSRQKRIPLRIVNAARPKVARFLGLYFCADGWTDGSGVHFASASPEICRSLKRMLLRFGIVSNLHSREVNGYGRHWTLSVADKEMARRFLLVVDAHLTAIKRAKAERWSETWGSNCSATNIGIPAAFVEVEVSRRMVVTGRSRRSLGVDTGAWRGCRVVHRRTLDSLLYSERLEDLRTGDLLWDTVTSIEYVGDKECFDFQMANPDRPYAVVEDFLVHNCGKKVRELMAKEREGFVAGVERMGHGAKLGTELFDIIEKFADYAFNKSHSYGYGLVSYQTAYLKANYPSEYLSCLLTSVKSNLDKAAVYLAECRTMGIEVTVPDINRAAMDFAPSGDQIIFGLSAVRNVGEGLVEMILAERDENGPFADFYDFCQRVNTQALNKKTVESLIKAGAFDSLGHPRQGLVASFEQIVDQTLARRREHDMGVMSLFGAAEEGPSFDERPQIPDLEFSKRQRLAFEKEMLGLYVSDHPLMGAEASMRRRAECTVPELTELEDGAQRRVGGVITGLQRKWTKKGDLMAVFTLEDLQGAIEAMVFPKTMSDIGHLLDDDVVVIVEGRVDKREDSPKLIVRNVEVFEPMADTTPPLRIQMHPTHVSDDVVERLKGLLSEFPGRSEVFIHLGERQVIRLPDQFTVDASGGLVGELRVLLGAEAVRL
jgi:DNA polymerase-3 subunit alpha